MKYFLKKLLLHLPLSLAICLIIGGFSVGGRVYSGFAAAFLGAAYLLAGWMSYLKAGDGSPLDRLKRKKAPSVPYYLRRDKEAPPKVGFPALRHDFDDDCDEQAFERESLLPAQIRYKLRGGAFAVCGAVLLAASLFI